MKNLYLLSILFLLASDLSAQSAGPNNPGTFTTVAIPGSNKTWLQIGNVAVTDNAYSNFFNLSGGVGAYTDYLVATNFGFTIPAGAIIKGIIVEVERADPNSRTSDYRVRIVKNGSVMTSDRSAGAYPATDTYTTYGGAGDLWGQFWTHNDINNSGFGIALAAQRSVAGGSTGGRIDHIRITVIYDNPTTLPVRLTSFTASKNNNNVTVKWRTADESNMRDYTLERSTNGIDFTGIHTVASHNNSFPTEYSYNDNDPVRGISYYRLKMSGSNGDAHYSNVVAVTFTDNGSIDLYPSSLSAGQVVTIRGAGDDPVTIYFYTQSGQKIGNVTTINRQFSTQQLEKQKGIIYYHAFRENGEKICTGRMLIK